MIKLAKIFGVIGVVAYALGSYYIFMVTRLGTNSYWATDYGGLVHLVTTLGAAGLGILSIFIVPALLASMFAWVSTLFASRRA